MEERKVAIVTGAGSGIGAATAQALADRGYNILINYFSNELSAKNCELNCQLAGADTLIWQADVSDDAACIDLATAAANKWGRIDALINNAGITVFAKRSEWSRLTFQDFQNIYSVNAIGAFQMVRACVQYLKLSRGSVVNVSSIAGMLGRGSSVPYIMSKGALNSLTLHLARELAPEIRVNAVCPGFVSTGWFRNRLGDVGHAEAQARYEQQAVLNCVNTPESIAECIAWLISSARTVTGELLLVDAGLHLGDANSHGIGESAAN